TIDLSHAVSIGPDLFPNGQNTGSGTLMILDPTNGIIQQSFPREEGWQSFAVSLDETASFNAAMGITPSHPNPDPSVIDPSSLSYDTFASWPPAYQLQYVQVASNIGKEIIVGDIPIASLNQNIQSLRNPTIAIGPSVPGNFGGASGATTLVTLD